MCSGYKKALVYFFYRLKEIEFSFYPSTTAKEERNLLKKYLIIRMVKLFHKSKDNSIFVMGFGNYKFTSPSGNATTNPKFEIRCEPKK